MRLLADDPAAAVRDQPRAKSVWMMILIRPAAALGRQQSPAKVNETLRPRQLISVGRTVFRQRHPAIPRIIRRRAPFHRPQPLIRRSVTVLRLNRPATATHLNQPIRAIILVPLHRPVRRQFFLCTSCGT